LFETEICENGEPSPSIFWLQLFVVAFYLGTCLSSVITVWSVKL